MREHEEMRERGIRVASPWRRLAAAAGAMNRHGWLLALLVLVTLVGCAATGAGNPWYDPYLLIPRHGNGPDF